MIAIAAGVVDGLGLGHNALAALINQALVSGDLTQVRYEYMGMLIGLPAFSSER